MESKGLLRCKIVVVGDTQCGKTALLHVFAKDSYPEVRPLHLVQTRLQSEAQGGSMELQRLKTPTASFQIGTSPKRLSTFSPDVFFKVSFVLFSLIGQGRAKHKFVCTHLTVHICRASAIAN